MLVPLWRYMNPAHRKHTKDKLDNLDLLFVITTSTLTFRTSAKSLLWACCPVSKLGKVLAVGLHCSPSVLGKRCKVVKTTSLLRLLLHGPFLRSHGPTVLQPSLTGRIGHFLSCPSPLQTWLWQKLNRVTLHLPHLCLVCLLPLHSHFLRLSPAPQSPLVSPDHEEACDELVWSPVRRIHNIFIGCSYCDTVKVYWSENRQQFNSDHYGLCNV